MTDNDAKLAAFFAAAEPPALDHAFGAEVMHRVARRKLREDMVRLSLACVIGVAVLWVLSPGLAALVRDISQASGPMGGALLLAVAVIVAATRTRLFRATSRT